MTLVMAVTLAVEARSEMILQIYREPLKPGREEAYRAIEEDTARACATLACPHPHLAMESLTGPKEVWWLNTFESEAQRQQVTDDYKANRPLMAALERNGNRKASVTRTGENIFARYRSELSLGVRWNPSGARFLVVTMTRSDRLPDGPVFEAPDGTRFVLRAVATCDEATGMAQATGPDTTVFAVRPYWGMPAREWIAADPEFWKASPLAGAR
jgi:hypothetical protein